MPTGNVNLTPRFDKFIAAGVRSGRYSNASEVVREGLRLLEQREKEEQAKLEWLQNAVQKSLADVEKGNHVTLRSRAEVKQYLRGLAVQALEAHRKETGARRKLA